MQEPVFILRASDLAAPQLVRGMVDRRRTELLGAERTPEIEAELKQLSRYDEIAEDMTEWRFLSGKRV